MDAIILKTLKAVKASGFDINRETLDNVDYCISLIASNGKPEESKKSLSFLKKKLTREELDEMKYWDIRKKYNIAGEKSMKKEELIEIILKEQEA